jgi:predicted small lipoprotein YifL
MVFAAAAMLISLLSGCAPKGPVYVDAAASYDKTSALAILAAADASNYASRPTSDGVELRHDALAELRRKSPSASGVADLITTTFPRATSGVPVYVEKATFEGKPAVIVVEATGPPSGKLSSKRIWVLGENGDILFAGSR